jgi:hypothetical protein
VRQHRVATIDLAAKVDLIGPAVEADSVIWTARLKTDRVVTFLASVSKDFRAAALIASVAAEVLAAIASVAVEVLVVAALDALAASAGVASEDDAEINAWNFPILFLEKLKPQTNP